MAERKVFEHLRTWEPAGGGVCFHSLELPSHAYKLVGELDFVVLTPAGLIVLEVKGGRIACHDGIWTFTDRFGREHRRAEGPFSQARGGMYALLRRMKQDLPRQLVDELRVGYGVVFPDATWDLTSTEWDQHMVVDARACRSARAFRRAVDDLIRYWVDKASRRKRDLSREDLKRIAAFLRPDFERVPTLHHRASGVEAAVVALTEEQYRVLDQVGNNPRILCSGGAGTGKTFLAMEIARRHAADGDVVLLTCQNPLLAKFLRSRAKHERLEVIDLRSAVERGVASDVLVVDEGQDLLNMASLDDLDGLVKGGLAEGRWRIFLDGNNQASVVGSFDADAVEVLKSYGGCDVRLTDNCRNTKQVVIQTRLFTGGDIGLPMIGEGMPVDIQTFATDTEQVARLTAYIEHAVGGGVPTRDITIISPRPFDESCAAALPQRWKKDLFVVTGNTEASWPPQALTFAQVPHIKGLENKFIAVVDIHNLDSSEEARSTLYVAMTRARVGLLLSFHQSLEEEASRLAEARLPLILETLTGGRHGR